LGSTEKVKWTNLAKKMWIPNMLFGVDLLRTEVTALSVASIESKKNISYFLELITLKKLKGQIWQTK
jgi:hypothetical protein